MARPDIKKIPGARKSKLFSFIPPQLATLVKEPPSGDEWLHELKFDGYRMSAVSSAVAFPSGAQTEGTGQKKF